MPGRVTLIHSVLSAALLAGVAAWAGPPSPGTRITVPAELQPPAVSVLARHLTTTAQEQQWEFAAISLDVLLDTYTRELHSSAREKASTPARRAKLARWQRATLGLIDQLQAARASLGQGARFNIHVDPRHQILIIVDRQTIVVSGPRAGPRDEIADSILEHYCAYNDCSILQTTAAAETAAETETTGTWVLRQRMPPAYEIGSDLRCEFDTLAERDRKVRACTQLSTELQRLVMALRQAAAQGFVIDWRRLLDSPPTTTPHAILVIDAEGAYLQLELELLVRVDRNDWEEMLDWLQRRLNGGSQPLVISRTERYLPH